MPPQALLHCAKNSMNMLKNRIQSRTGGTGAFLFVQKPFFEVRVAAVSTAAPLRLSAPHEQNIYIRKHDKT